MTKKIIGVDLGGTSVKIAILEIFFASQKSYSIVKMLENPVILKTSITEG